MEGLPGSEPPLPRASPPFAEERIDDEAANLAFDAGLRGGNARLAGKPLLGLRDAQGPVQ